MLELLQGKAISARRIRRNLIVITAVVLAASLLGQFLLLRHRQNVLETDAVAQQATTYAGMIDQHFGFYRNLVEQLAAQQRAVDILTFGSNIEAEQWARQQRNVIAESAAVALFRANGKMILSHSELDIAGLMQTYRARLGGCGRMASPLILRGVSGSPYFALSRPLGRCGDSFLGTITLAFKLGILTSSMQKSLRPQQRLSIFDNRGNMVASLGARSTPDSEVITRSAEVPNSGWTVELETQPPTDHHVLLLMALATSSQMLIIIGALVFATRRLALAFQTELNAIHSMLDDIQNETPSGQSIQPRLIESRPIFSAISHVAERIQTTQQALRSTSLTDELTGLPNRRHFNLVATQLFNLAQRGQSVVVAFIDVDHFKVANDKLGHAAGDEILRIAAHIFKTKLRAADFVARIGGDEFIVMAINQESERIEAMLSALGQRFQAAQQEGGITNQGVACTFSIGYACVDPDQDKVVDDTLQRADSALYAAKAAGRNCVVGK